jgi:UDP:flavonoid glycosyltransferase YjiC (YdhE family)
VNCHFQSSASLSPEKVPCFHRRSGCNSTWKTSTENCLQFSGMLIRVIKSGLRRSWIQCTYPRILKNVNLITDFVGILCGIFLFWNAASCRLYLFTLPEDLEPHQYRYENVTCRMTKIFFPFRSLNKLQKTPHIISYTVSWDTHYPVLSGSCLGVLTASAEYQTLPVLSSPLLVVIVSAILPVSDRHCHFSGVRLNLKSRVWNVAKRCVVSCMPATGISPVFLPS